MKLIAHRGNINGPNKEKENNPDYCLEAINSGYDVEIDVWYIDNKLYTGHDEPTYGPIDYKFFLNKNIWIHAKNGDAFNLFINNCEANVFWHTTEDWVLTSCGFVWTYPNKTLYPKSICVLPELGYSGDLNQCYAICTDFINEYKRYE